jgi:hypothetical protein
MGWVVNAMLRPIYSEKLMVSLVQNYWCGINNNTIQCFNILWLLIQQAFVTLMMKWEWRPKWLTEDDHGAGYLKKNLFIICQIMNCVQYLLNNPLCAVSTKLLTVCSVYQIISCVQYLLNYQLCALSTKLSTVCSIYQIINCVQYLPNYQLCAVSTKLSAVFSIY